MGTAREMLADRCECAEQIIQPGFGNNKKNRELAIKFVNQYPAFSILKIDGRRELFLQGEGICRFSAFTNEPNARLADKITSMNWWRNSKLLILRSNIKGPYHLYLSHICDLVTAGSRAQMRNPIDWTVISENAKNTWLLCPRGPRSPCHNQEEDLSDIKGLSPPV